MCPDKPQQTAGSGASGTGGETLECRNPLDGTPIRLHLCGAGPDVLLVHGWTLDRRSFAPQRPVADECRLVSYDRRGCGESSAAPDLLAEPGDIDTIIDALGGGPLVLLGVSQGARIALRYAARQPQRLRGLILQGAVLDGYSAATNDDGAIPLAHYRDLLLRGAIETLREEWLAHPLMASDDLDETQSAALRAMVDDYRGEDLRVPAPTTAPASLEEALREVDVPTLIITGERETAARRAHAARLLATLPRAREVLLADCGHLSNLSRPEAYNALLRDFLRGLSARQESS